MEQGCIMFSLFLLVLIISPLPAKAEEDDNFRFRPSVRPSH
jgi:hypothetical protein